MKKTKSIQKKSDFIPEKDYQNLLQELKSILNTGLYSAYKTVDNIKVQTYWQIGERIVREELKNKDRADYGKYLVDSLAVDLNFKKPRLYEIIQFYRTYPIVRALHGQLSWYHYLELIKVKNEKVRQFYEQKIIQNSWSYRELRQQIKSQLYENTNSQEIDAILKTNLQTITSPEIFKNIYDFRFIETEALTPNNEQILEKGLVKNITNFLKELGPDFSFTGQQVPIKIDNQTHFIDLVLYNRGIPCVVLVDLKIDKLNSRDVGQMNKYIGYWRKNCQYEHEKDTIGLIICQDAGKEEVAYALDGLEEKIFVAKYKVKLPSESQIKKAIKKLK